MRFRITTLLGLTLLAALAVSAFYKPHPDGVMEMLDYITELPRTIEQGVFPEIPGPYAAEGFDRKSEYLKLFSPMSEGYFLLTLIDEDKIQTGDQMKGIAVLKNFGENKWRFVFPIFMDDQLVWQCDSVAPNPYDFMDSANMNQGTVENW